MLFITTIDKSLVLASASPNGVKFAELDHFVGMVKTKIKTNISKAPEKRFRRKNR